MKTGASKKTSKSSRAGRKRSVKKRSTVRRVTGPTDWTKLTDAKLLDLRICDLKLKIEGTELEANIQRLYQELKTRDLNFRPHCWLSDEWFSPDGIPGIAIPFFLAHPRLKRLERKQMLEVEGGTQEWCLRILRHEAGHTVDSAFQLHRRRRWRDLFGKFTEPYPDTYQPKPYSKSYVLHLDPWYAQSHPAEDFAETFAVWLKPRSRWKTQYEGWPAMRKLQYVEDLMGGLNGSKPKARSRKKIDPVSTIRKTLREHYAEKRSRYQIGMPKFYDRELRRLFSESPGKPRRRSAAAFLRRIRPELRRVVARWTGQYRYTIDQLLGEMIERCRELNLFLDRPEQEVERDAMVMLTAQTMNYLHSGNHRFAL